MALVYDIGDRPVVTLGNLTTTTDVITYATGAEVNVLSPAGVQTDYNSPDASIVLGVAPTNTITFTFPAALTQSGAYTVKITATAGTGCAAEADLQVRRSRVT